MDYEISSVVGSSCSKTRNIRPPLHPIGTEEENSALQAAVEKNDFDTVVHLLHSGSDINLCDNASENTLLHTAANLGYADMCVILIQHGAGINAQNQAGITPLFLASRVNLPTVSVLLELGADVELCNNLGEIPLHSASSCGLTDVILLLASYGSDVNFPSLQGLTPLCFAITSGSRRAVETLIGLGAEVNVVLSIQTSNSLTKKAVLKQGSGTYAPRSDQDVRVRVSRQKQLQRQCRSRHRKQLSVPADFLGFVRHGPRFEPEQSGHQPRPHQHTHGLIHRDRQWGRDHGPDVPGVWKQGHRQLHRLEVSAKSPCPLSLVCDNGEGFQKGNRTCKISSVCGLREGSKKERENSTFKMSSVCSLEKEFKKGKESSAAQHLSICQLGEMFENGRENSPSQLLSACDLGENSEKRIEISTCRISNSASHSKKSEKDLAKEACSTFPEFENETYHYCPEMVKLEHQQFQNGSRKTYQFSDLDDNTYQHFPEPVPATYQFTELAIETYLAPDAKQQDQQSKPLQKMEMERSSLESSSLEAGGDTTSKNRAKKTHTFAVLADVVQNLTDLNEQSKKPTNQEELSQTFTVKEIPSQEAPQSLSYNQDATQSFTYEEERGENSNSHLSATQMSAENTTCATMAFVLSETAQSLSSLAEPLDASGNNTDVKQQSASRQENAIQSTTHRERTKRLTSRIVAADKSSTHVKSSTPAIHKECSSKPTNHIAGSEKSTNQSGLVGLTPLHRACQLGMESVARVLLEAGSHVSATTTNGETPLHFAALYSSTSGHGEVTGLLRLLFRTGADIQAVTSQEGSTALHLSASVGDALCTSLLISAGADVHKRDSKGNSPLHKACERLVSPESNRVRTVRVLLMSGASAKILNSEGLTPLHVLLMHKTDDMDHDVLRVLLNYGADPNYPMPSGESPLLAALRYHMYDFAKVLLEKGAHPNVQYDDGKTPMHFVCQDGHVTLFKLLWTKGGSPVVVDRNGFTPLRYAVEKGDEAIIQVCMSSGASVLQPSQNITLPSLVALFDNPTIYASLFLFAFASAQVNILQILYRSGCFSLKEFHTLKSLCGQANMDELTPSQRLAADFILRVTHAPPSLQNVARWKVSRLIGCCADRKRRVHHLPVPKLLCEFVLFAKDI